MASLPADRARPAGWALSDLLLVAGALACGCVLALVAERVWLAPLAGSLAGVQPKAYWFLSRASGLVAFGLLSLATALGLLVTGRVAPLWPGGPAAVDLHRHLSLLAVASTAFHALILLGDDYIAYTVPQLLVPFHSDTYRPLWIGLGQVALYLLLPVALSVYVRQRIGYRAWRLLHYLSFAVYLLSLGHGVLSGSDSADPWAAAAYWGSGGTVLFLLLYRVLVARLARRPRHAPARPAD